MESLVATLDMFLVLPAHITLCLKCPSDYNQLKSVFILENKYRGTGLFYRYPFQMIPLKHLVIHLFSKYIK